MPCPALPFSARLNGGSHSRLCLPQHYLGMWVSGSIFKRVHPCSQKIPKERDTAHTHTTKGGRRTLFTDVFKPLAWGLCPRT